jgi:hypothetical protein
MVDHGVPNYYTTSTSTSDNPNLDPFSSSAMNAIATSVSRLARSDRESSPPTPSVPNNPLLIPSIHAKRIGINTL